MLKELLQSRWFTAVAITITGFFLISIIKLEPSLITAGKELKHINQKIDEARKNTLELEKLGDYLQTDAYLERQARLKLNYKKPDEKVVYIYDKTAETEKTAGTQSESEISKIFESELIHNFKKWWRYLME